MNQNQNHQPQPQEPQPQEPQPPAPQEHPEAESTPQVLAPADSNFSADPSADRSAEAASDDRVESQMRSMSRRSFLWGALAVGSGYGGVRWIASRRADEGIAWPLRRVLQANEEVARDFFGPTRMAPTFASWQVRPLRFNGDVGLGPDFEAGEWELAVDGLGGDEPMKSVTLAQIRALPHVEMITELKCIEGWATIVRWGGVRLRDFMAKFPPPTSSGAKFDARKPGDLPGFVGMATPDGAYYVGLEVEAALHPQTLLCYEMNGEPLKPEHGAPLRLAIPLKYGVKNIKRIGSISYLSHRPPDYWAEQGYDYYAGH